MKAFTSSGALAIVALQALSAQFAECAPAVYGTADSCVGGTLMQGTYCLCEADKALTTDSNGASVCTTAPFEAAKCAAAAVPDSLSLTDDVSVANLAINKVGSGMVMTLQQPRTVGRKVTGITLGSCTFSADNTAPTTGTGAIAMLPATSECVHSFTVEFDWAACMENADSMTKTASADGLSWVYSGYMEIDLVTPPAPAASGSALAAIDPALLSLKQQLSRAVEFSVPRTVSVGMTSEPQADITPAEAAVDSAPAASDSNNNNANNMWTVNMNGKDGKNVLVMNDAFPMDVVISSLKNLGQQVANVQLVDALRTVPGSANADCATPTSIIDNVAFHYTPGTKDATAFVLADNKVVCDAPVAGSAALTHVELTLHLKIDIFWSGRRRRATATVPTTASISVAATPEDLSKAIAKISGRAAEN